MRTIKDPDVRRSEILDTAQQLFITKGYAKTTIMDLLNAIGIAKGTFYYYFKSKEEVMDAVIGRLIEQDVQRAGQIAADKTLSPLEKFYRILKTQQPVQDDTKDKILEQFHHPANAEMHQKGLVLSIQTLCPVLAGVVEEAVAQGVLATPYPREAVELLMVSGQILFDQGLFHWEAAQYAGKVEAYIHNMELLLGAKTGSLHFMADILSPQS